MKKLVFPILAAFGLWFIMFSPLTAPYFSFWHMMTVSAVCLTALALAGESRWRWLLRFSVSDILLGVALAAALWGIFWIGDKVSGLLFSFARPEVDEIYSIKDGVSPVLLSLLLLFVIGPAEEIFWRGFIQERISGSLGADLGFVVATALYAAVHVASCNFMLVMASLVAGTVWGLGYRFFPERFTALVISHALWDAAVFVWMPV